MKEIMSINYKFMELSPKELVDLVTNTSTTIAGFEISVNKDNPIELKYMHDLAFECNKNKLILQIHGNSNLSIEKQIEFLKEVEKIYNYSNRRINVVMHPLTGKNKSESIKLTSDYLNELSYKIDNKKIMLSIENLNDFNQEEDRLDKDDIIAIVCNNENIYMTYDIGHEIIDGGKITDLNKSLISLISNVHLHSFNFAYDCGFDHKPILINDENWNQILKGILFLKSINYEGTVVFEYDLYACIGTTIEDKIKSYISSMDYVGQRFL